MLRFFVIGLIFVQLSVFASPSYATSSNLQQSPKVQEELVITATRHHENPLALPLAIDKLSAEAVLADQGQHISASLNQIPGVQINQLSANSSPGHNTSIRMPINYGPYYLYLQDGVPLQSTGSFNHNGLWWSSYATSVGSIEVAKGPGTALYGSDALAGVINVSSQAPSLTASGQVYYQVADYGQHKLRVSQSNTLQSGHAYRLSASVEGADGWREKSDYERQELLIRHEYENDSSFFKTVFLFNTMDGHNQTALLEEAFNNDSRDHGLASDDIDPYRQTDSLRLSSEIVTRFDDHLELNLIPFVTQSTNDYVATWVPDTLPQNQSTNASLGLLAKLQVYHSPDAYTIVGLDTIGSRGERLYEQVTEDTVVWGKTYLQGKIYDYEVKTQNLAPYVAYNRQIASRVTLDLGVRYDHARFDYTNQLADGDFGQYLRPADREDTFEHVSPKLGLTYRVAENSSVYGRYAQAFRMPQTDTLYSLKVSNAQSSLKPEVADSLEFGYKYFDGSTRLSATAYLMDISDAIVTDNTDAGLSFKTNAGRTRHQGIELGFSRHFASGFYGQLGYAFSSHSFEDYVTEGTDLSGKEHRLAPEHSGNLRVGYAPENRYRIKVQVEVEDIGAWWMDDENTRRGEGYKLLNLKAQADLIKDVTVGLKLNNVANKKYAQQSEIAYGKARFTPGGPRQFSAHANYRF